MGIRMTERGPWDPFGRWQMTAYEMSGDQSGAVTIDPSLGHRQSMAVTGNITGLACALSADYPAVVVEITTDGDYTLATTGWETDGGAGIDLPVSGKCIILLFLSADGSTKYALLAATEVA
jgi:hypothetical protein